MLEGSNCIILDLETLRSADDCRHCGFAKSQHTFVAECWLCTDPVHGLIGGGLPYQFEALGWQNKPALGLSIGCYWDYRDSRIHWFDQETLEDTVHHLVTRYPLMVSFNGIGFDFVVMRGLLRQAAEALQQDGEAARLLEAQELVTLCDTFKAQCATSYDILAEVWKADPVSKRQAGVNTLDAIAQANGLGAKRGHGAQAPRDWTHKRYARVLNYCQDDVYKTKGLFELIVQRGTLMRADGVALPVRAPLLMTSERQSTSFLQ